MIPSLPEGVNFTVGGCLAGLGLGSSSYIYGFFGDYVIEDDENYYFVATLKQGIKLIDKYNMIGSQ